MLTLVRLGSKQDFSQVYLEVEGLHGGTRGDRKGHQVLVGNLCQAPTRNTSGNLHLSDSLISLDDNRP